MNIKELCMIKWVLHFKQAMSEESVRPFEAIFHEDFSLVTTMHGRMNWQASNMKHSPKSEIKCRDNHFISCVY